LRGLAAVKAGDFAVYAVPVVVLMTPARRFRVPNIRVKCPSTSERYANLPCQTEINWSGQTGRDQMLKPRADAQQ
jgi:hypothetical protein